MNEDRARFTSDVHDLELQDIHDFIKERGVNISCLACGSRQLAPLQAVRQRADGPGIEPIPGKPAIIARPVHARPEDDFELRVPAFVVSCRNCGFNYDFSVTPLLDWKYGRVQE